MHVAMPGVPDLYQGAELWNFALVDPDNRRPVDYTRPRAVLAELKERFDGGDQAARAEYVSELLANVEDGRIKMHVTRQLLRARRADPALFLEGSYSPVQATGALGRHLVGFARAHAGSHAVGFGGRLSRSLTGGTTAAIGDVWRDTRVFLPEPLADVRRWTCVVSGNSVDVPRDAAATGLRVADVLHHLPVALLVRADRPSMAVRSLEP
jgi:(1->4)-alpha-D-glucan 1-alpha-D-glucosylmutase